MEKTSLILLADAVDNKKSKRKQAVSSRASTHTEHCRDALASTVRTSFGRGNRIRERRDHLGIAGCQLWIAPGEVVGIIAVTGRVIDAAQILSVLGTDSGTGGIVRTVAACLEVGTGFHPTNGRGEHLSQWRHYGNEARRDRTQFDEM